MAYQVDRIKVIEPDITDDLRRVIGGDYCTLLTCTPYGVNSHRLLIRGSRVAYDPEAHGSIKAVTGSVPDFSVLRAAVVTGSVMAFLVLLTYLDNSRRSDSAKRVARRPRPKRRLRRASPGMPHVGTLPGG
jgi:sortase A